MLKLWWFSCFYPKKISNNYNLAEKVLIMYNDSWISKGRMKFGGMGDIKSALSKSKMNINDAIQVQMRK